MTTTPNLSPEDRARIIAALLRPRQPRAVAIDALSPDPADQRWARVQPLTPMEPVR